MRRYPGRVGENEDLVEPLPNARAQYASQLGSSHLAACRCLKSGSSHLAARRIATHPSWEGGTPRPSAFLLWTRISTVLFMHGTGYGVNLILLWTIVGCLGINKLTSSFSPKNIFWITVHIHLLYILCYIYSIFLFLDFWRGVGGVAKKYGFFIWPPCVWSLLFGYTPYTPSQNSDNPYQSQIEKIKKYITYNI